MLFPSLTTDYSPTVNGTSFFVAGTSRVFLRSVGEDVPAGYKEKTRPILSGGNGSTLAPGFEARV